MVVVHLAYLLKVGGALQALDELVVQRLQYVDLEIGINVIHQEAHVLPQLHCLSKELIVRHVFHCLDLELPSILQLDLDTLDRQQEPEQSIVLLNCI